MYRCLFCGGDADARDHLRRCDGRQGRVEAAPLPVFDGIPVGPPTAPRFNGATYEPRYDDARLTGQLRRIWDVMQDGGWHTLHEVAAATGDPEASISAQLRHMRKPRFGQHTIERRPRGERTSGLYEYRLVIVHGLAG